MVHVGGRGHLMGKFRKRRETADFLKMGAPTQFIARGDDIHGLVAPGDGRQGGKNLAVDPGKFVLPKDVQSALYGRSR